MSLRFRLIVVFVVFSVVPLGAMTWYGYTRSVQALRDAAEHESDMLAVELSQRMQLVTAQLSSHVEQLMDVEREGDTGGTMAAAVAPDAPGTGLTSLLPTIETQVADRLGEAAMLLNNVELRGLGPRSPAATSAGAGRSGRGRRGGGLPPSQPGQAGQPGQPSAAGRSGRPGRPPTPEAPAAASTSATPTAVAPLVVEPTAVGPSVAGGSGGEPPPVPVGAADRIRVDLGAARRALFREIAPDKSFQEMDAAERQRVVGAVNQRLLGIQQGLKLGAGAAIEQKAAEARDAAKQVTRPATALTGNHLNVQRERNGVVRQVDAEVNLTDLLSMVFTATPRDRGEVPFAVDPSGHLYTATDEDRARVEGLGAGTVTATSTTGARRLPAWIVVTANGPEGSDLKFGVARPVGAALSEIRRTTLRSAALGVLFMGVALLAVVPLSVGLTRKLSRLNAGVHRIAGGDYRARVDVSGRDDIGRLGQAFNQMAQDVEAHRDAAVGQERIRRELELGRQIQDEMLPRAPLVSQGVEVHGLSRPAGEVGGDFFNYLTLSDGRVALLVGDVSGKGVGAALLMSNIQASLRTRLMLGQNLTAMCDEIDRDLALNTPGAVYATLFIGVLDPATRMLRYVNAGHPPSIVVRATGRIERLPASGLPTGLLAGHGYRELDVQLEPGDRVFCYTDGCIELENDAGEMFNVEGLERVLSAEGRADAASVLRRVDAALQAFRGSREPADDLTMMVTAVMPPG